MWGSSSFNGFDWEDHRMYKKYAACEYMEEEKIEIVEERVVYDWNHQGRSATVRNIRVVKRTAPPPPVWTHIVGKNATIPAVKEERTVPIVLEYNHEETITKEDDKSKVKYDEQTAANSNQLISANDDSVTDKYTQCDNKPFATYDDTLSNAKDEAKPTATYDDSLPTAKHDVKLTATVDDKPKPSTTTTRPDDNPNISKYDNSPSAANYDDKPATANINKHTTPTPKGGEKSTLANNDKPTTSKNDGKAIAIQYDNKPTNDDKHLAKYADQPTVNDYERPTVRDDEQSIVVDHERSTSTVVDDEQSTSTVVDDEQSTSTVVDDEQSTSTVVDDEQSAVEDDFIAFRKKVDMECRKRKWDQNTVILNPLYKAPPTKRSNFVFNPLLDVHISELQKHVVEKAYEKTQQIKDVGHFTNDTEILNKICFKNVPEIDWNECKMKNTKIQNQKAENILRPNDKEVSNRISSNVGDFTDKHELYINGLKDYKKESHDAEPLITFTDTKCSLIAQDKTCGKNSTDNLNSSMSDFDVSCISDISLIPLDSESDIEVLFEDTESILLSDVDFNMYMKGSSQIVNIKSESSERSKPGEIPNENVSRILSCYK